MASTMNKFIIYLQSQQELESTWAQVLKKSWGSALMKAIADEKIPPTWDDAPRPLINEKILELESSESRDYKSLSPLDFNPAELARQLTLMHHKLFVSIPFPEFLRGRFKKIETSPHIHILIDKFNIITKWIGTEVATTPNLRYRQRALTHFIMLAEKLKKLGNWHGFLAVITGLSQNAVQRLHQTWKSLPPNTTKKWQDLFNIATPIQNFSGLREAMKNSTPPFVPPLTIHVKDLTFIEDGNEDWKNKEDSLLNYHKMEMLGKILNQVRSAQVVHYHFTNVNVIQEYLKNLYYVNNIDDLLVMAKKIEKIETEM